MTPLKSKMIARIVWFIDESSYHAGMQLARVIGTVVATVKNDSLRNRKLMVVQSLNKDLAPQGKPMVAVDAAGAGVLEACGATSSPSRAATNSSTFTGFVMYR